MKGQKIFSEVLVVVLLMTSCLVGCGGSTPVAPTEPPVPTDTPEPTSTPQPHVEVEGGTLELREVFFTDSVTIEGQQWDANPPYGILVVVKMWTSLSDVDTPCTWSDEDEVKLGWKFAGGESENGWSICQSSVGDQMVKFIFTANRVGEDWYMLFPGGERLSLEVTPTRTFARNLTTTPVPTQESLWGKFTPIPTNTPKPINTYTPSPASTPEPISTLIPTDTPEPTATPVPPTNTPIPTAALVPVSPSQPYVEVEGGSLELREAVFMHSINIGGDRLYAAAPFDTLVVVEMQVSFSDVNIPCNWRGEDQVKLGWGFAGVESEEDWSVCQSSVSGQERMVKFIFAANGVGRDWYLLFPGGKKLHIEVTP